MKANFLLPASVLTYAATEQSLAAPMQDAGVEGPVDITEPEKIAGVAVAHREYAPGNVKRYGATGGGRSDDTEAIQAGINAAQAANFSFPVYLPAGDYMISSPLKVRGDAPKTIVMTGEGGAFGIRNTKITVGDNWSGKSMVQGDGVRKNGWTASDIWFDAGGKAHCIMDLREFNYLVLRGCRFSSATGFLDKHGVAAVMLKNGWVTRIENCVFAGCRDGLFSDNSTNNLTIWGCVFVLSKGMGLHVRGCQSVNISGTVFEDCERGGILLDVGRCVWISGNHFEMNGGQGYRFLKGEKRTIRADIIVNGWISPEISSREPSKSIGVYGNIFLPPKAGPFDASVYLISVDGFSESSNDVHWPYPSTAAFVKTKHRPGLYRAANVTLGNSFVAGLPRNGGSDSYFEIEGLNDERMSGTDVEAMKSIYIHPQHAPRFDAHEDLGFDPENYAVLENVGRPLKISRSESRRMGRPVYVMEGVAAAGSDVIGFRIPESAYDAFWAGKLWVAYLEVRRDREAAAFELSVRTGDLRLSHASRVKASGGFEGRMVVFKPVAGTEIVVGMQMSGPPAPTRVALTRPIVCPLGAMGEVPGSYVA